jgi:hypothetical protein
MRLRGTAAIMVALATVMALLSASGSSAATVVSEKSNKSAVVRAITTSTHTKTLKMQMTMAINVDGTIVTADVDGGVNLSPFTASFLERVSTNRGGKPKTIPLLITKDRVYLQVPARATDLPQWYYVPTSQVGGTVGLNGSPSFDFGLTLGLHSGSISDVRVVGQKKVNGWATTEYDETVNVAKELGGASNGDALGTSSLGQFAQLAGTQTVSEEMWVDHTSHVRKAMLSFPISLSYLKKQGMGAYAFGSFQLSETFSDFGVGLFIVPPPDSQVQPLPASLQGAVGGVGVAA